MQVFIRTAAAYVQAIYVINSVRWSHGRKMQLAASFAFIINVLI